MHQSVHLARKWRSAHFDGIVGQDLAVRILKNSLYTGTFFPVYLLAGQHGCGKTTTARVFAAAVNCARLSDFQRDPTQVIPCQQCESCLAMAAGRHPDFHEIDAASHTGVDHARQIVEAASMVPVGRRKIYLIDEAHMLSKAAFNALLKMLEEPPPSTLFMLATTDDQKILETVKSRCFQLFFRAVAPADLQAHLERVCQAETIAYEPAALAMIIKETGGSVRDALTMVEQVFLSARHVGVAELDRVLGYVPAAQMVHLLKTVVHAAQAHEVLQCMQQIANQPYNPERLWLQWVRLVHAAVWQAYGVPADCPVDREALQQVLDGVAADQMVRVCTAIYEFEPVFVKTAHQAAVLPMHVLDCWQRLHTQSVAPLEKPKHVPTVQPVAVASESKVCAPSVAQTPWQQWLEKLEKTDDSLLYSIFKQATFEGVNQGVVTARFAHRLSLFNDTVQQRTGVWEPLLKEVFGDTVRLEVRFVKDETPVTPVSVPAKPVVPVAAPVRSEERIDVSDKERWPVTHALLQEFPGVVVKVTDVGGQPHE